MRTLLLSGLILSSLMANSVFAANNNGQNNDLNYNVVNIQAEASRKVSNDEMHAILFIEKTDKRPAELSSQINQLMNQAQNIAKKYPQVKFETGSQTTYPVYDNNTQKLKEWRGRAEINLESKDFKTASQLISELQQNFQTQSINFTVSDEQRKKVENELMVEASKNFQQRAQIVSQAWNKSSYNLVTLNIDANRSSIRPMMGSRVNMAKYAVAAEAAPAQDIAAGESQIIVNANGSIQFR